ncbi:MAG: NAD(P)-dependent oxidoreductase [Clostridiales bacterium]|nr:NAD(P)-dependent oxidoreductase [Clostridiales bacterium]
MKAIVTGATGFVGRELVRELCRQGNEVIAIVRREGNIPDWDETVQIIVCPLEEYQDLIKICQINADIFFHFAWESTSGTGRGDAGLQLENVLYTQNAIQLSKQCGCKRFVFAGSIMEYEAMTYIPKDDARPGMGYIYSVAKMAADFMGKTLANNLELEYINLIISNIYGPGENSARFLNSLIRKLMAGEDINLTEGLQKYDFIYITDAVKAICLAGISGKKNSAYYIGNSKQKPLREYILEAKNITGSDSVLKFGEIQYQGPLDSFQGIDTERLFRELHFIPSVTYEKGIGMIQ